MISLTVNIFPNKRVANVPNNILRSPTFCFFTSFWIVSLTYFNNNLECSRDLTFFLIFSISSFGIISVVIVPDPKLFFFIPASAADATNVYQIEIITLVTNGLIKFFINDNPVFRLRSLLRKPPDCITLDNWVFDSLRVGELLAKALRKFVTCLLVNNDLDGKLVSFLGLAIIFDDNLKTVLVSFFIADFNLLSCEFDSFTFKLFYWLILH